MLLARITEHVKAQNWFAVFVDFVVVVVGIFIGLQVSDWNQDRLDRKLEASYLLALQADLDATAENFDRFFEENAALRRDLSALAGFEQVVPGDIPTAELDRMIASGLWNLAILRIQMDAYEDLKFSIGTKLLGSQALRLELSRFESLLDRFHSAQRDMQEVQYRNIDPYLADHFPMRRFSEVFENASGLPESRAELPDYGAFISDVKTQSRLTMKFIGVNNTASMAQDLDESLMTLRELVAERLQLLGQSPH